MCPGGGGLPCFGLLCLKNPCYKTLHSSQAAQRSSHPSHPPTGTEHAKGDGKKKKNKGQPGAGGLLTPPGTDLHSALAQMRQAVVQLKKFRIPATATLMSVLLGWRLSVVKRWSCSFRNSSGATLK